MEDDICDFIFHLFAASRQAEVQTEISDREHEQCVFPLKGGVLQKLTSAKLPLPAVNCDGVVAGLLLLLLHCCDDVDHALAVGGDAHLRPAVEMKLTHRSSFVLLVT